MAKDDPEIVKLAGQRVFELFASADVPLLYHGYKRSRALVDETRAIAKGNKLNGEAGQALLIAAWFHDVGHATIKDASPEQGRAKSVELARAFLKDHGQPDSVGDAVAASLSALDPGRRDGVAGDVLHDALVARLAGKDFLEETELLRVEEERRSGKVYSDVDWTQSRIELLDKHTYRTRWAQLEYDGARAKNLGKLHKVLRKQLEQAGEQKNHEAKLSQSSGKTAEGLFGDLTRNQLKVVSVADRRTSTMIHVNAIMISLVVGLVLRKIEEHRNLIVPTIVLLCVNLTVVILSILSMRAGRELRNTRDEIAAHDGNILLTTNSAKVSLTEFVAHMNGLVADPAALQKSLFEYLYFLRNLISQRKRMLTITYDVFLYGLGISLALFTVAIVWF